VRRRFPLLLALLAALVLAAPAAAETIVANDREGRAITFDVQAPDVDVEWYAELLRNAAHGNEITRVTIRIVAVDDLRLICGAGAGGCYTGTTRAGRIVVPAGKTQSIAHALVHEYGHHVDTSYPVTGVLEPNGTPGWWGAREMDRLLRAGSVARDYRLGWDRSIAEVFAEDYVQLHLRTVYLIEWLGLPAESVLAALRSDISGAPAEPAPPVSTTPVVVTRRGTLAAQRSQSVAFQLLGPGRHVTFTARLAVTPRGAKARMEIRCSGRALAARALVRGRLTTIELRNRGPAACQAVVRNTGRTRATFASTLRLSLEPGATP
jgi:hypothetical protein